MLDVVFDCRWSDVLILTNQCIGKNHVSAQSCFVYWYLFSTMISMSLTPPCFFSHSSEECLRFPIWECFPTEQLYQTLSKSTRNKSPECRTHMLEEDTAVRYNEICLIGGFRYFFKWPWYCDLGHELRNDLKGVANVSLQPFPSIFSSYVISVNLKETPMVVMKRMTVRR